MNNEKISRTSTEKRKEQIVNSAFELICKDLRENHPNLKYVNYTHSNNVERRKEIIRERIRRLSKRKNPSEAYVNNVLEKLDEKMKAEYFESEDKTSVTPETSDNTTSGENILTEMNISADSAYIEGRANVAIGILGKYKENKDKIKTLYGWVDFLDRKDALSKLNDKSLRIAAESHKLDFLDILNKKIFDFSFTQDDIVTLNNILGHAIVKLEAQQGSNNFDQESLSEERSDVPISNHEKLVQERVEAVKKFPKVYLDKLWDLRTFLDRNNRDNVHLKISGHNIIEHYLEQEICKSILGTTSTNFTREDVKMLGEILNKVLFEKVIEVEPKSDNKPDLEIVDRKYEEFIQNRVNYLDNYTKTNITVGELVRLRAILDDETVLSKLNSSDSFKFEYVKGVFKNILDSHFDDFSKDDIQSLKEILDRVITLKQKRERERERKEKIEGLRQMHTLPEEQIEDVSLIAQKLDEEFEIFLKNADNLGEFNNLSTASEIASFINKFKQSVNTSRYLDFKNADIVLGDDNYSERKTFRDLNDLITGIVIYRKHRDLSLERNSKDKNRKWYSRIINNARQAIAGGVKTSVGASVLMTGVGAIPALVPQLRKKWDKLGRKIEGTENQNDRLLIAQLRLAERQARNVKWYQQYGNRLFRNFDNMSVYEKAQFSAATSAILGAGLVAAGVMTAPLTLAGLGTAVGVASLKTLLTTVMSASGVEAKEIMRGKDNAEANKKKWNSIFIGMGIGIPTSALGVTLGAHTADILKQELIPNITRSGGNSGSQIGNFFRNLFSGNSSSNSRLPQTRFRGETIPEPRPGVRVINTRRPESVEIPRPTEPATTAEATQPVIPTPVGPRSFNIDISKFRETGFGGIRAGEYYDLIRQALPVGYGNNLQNAEINKALETLRFNILGNRAAANEYMKTIIAKLASGQPKLVEIDASGNPTRWLDRGLGQKYMSMMNMIRNGAGGGEVSEHSFWRSITARSGQPIANISAIDVEKLLDIAKQVTIRNGNSRMSALDSFRAKVGYVTTTS